MLRFFIRVNSGDEDHLRTIKYEFVHKDWQTLSEKEQEEQWDTTIKELNEFYKKYGRFGTQAGVTSYFREHGFERTIS